MVLEWMAGVFVLNVVLGAALVLGVFGFMERHITAGAAGGVIVGAAVIYAEATFGEQILQVTVQEMKLLVLWAAIGGVIGVVGVVLTVKPEIE